MPPKKGKANAYYFWLLELRTKMDRDVAEKEAARLWPLMTAFEKEPYIKKARRSNNSMIKLTTLQEPINHIKNKQEEEEKQHLIMQDDIKRQIRFLKDTNAIADEYFHIMHVNTFFKTINDVLYPAEIGLVRFNLKQGVIEENIFDTLIKPGKFPLGYLSIAKTQSDSTHKIPYFNLENSNMEEVWINLIHFLQESAKSSSDPKKLPPIYVKDDFRSVVVSLLFQMEDEYGSCGEELRIYNLSYLLFTLRNDLSNSNVWPSITQSLNELDTDVFDTAQEIQCQFHGQIDNPVYCSRAHVVRMAYILCDNCCADLGIQLIPGKHVPEDATVTPLASSYAQSTIASSVHTSRPVSYAASVDQSYKTNLDTFVNDDVSTIIDSEDLNWQNVRPHRSMRCSQVAGQGADAAPRLPKTDWRNTAFGKGRGRGITAKK